jgi:hypothetical protein
MSKKMFFGGGIKKEPNVIIRGLTSPVFATKLELADFFYFEVGGTESNIYDFKISGNDVFFRVKNTFTTRISKTFNGNTNLVEIIDLENFFSEIDGNNKFANTTALNKIIANREGLVITSGSNGIFNGSNISNVEFNGVEKFGIALFNNANNLSYLKAESCTELAYRCLANTALETVYMPNLTTLKGFNLIGGVGQCFENMASVTLIDIKKCKIIGGTSNTDIQAFLNIKSGCVINVNDTLRDINSGSAHPDLVYAKTSRLAIVNFYDDSGNYVSTL